jgi:threonine dehydratase
MNISDLRTEITAASGRISDYIRRTPILTVPNNFGHGEISMKLEFLQRTGSFKARGAFNTLLSNDIPAAGVAAASGGNHGAAVAYAAQRLGVVANIFVPEISNAAKVEAIRSCGAELHIGGARYFQAQRRCDEFIAKSGALRVHPFDALSTIAGQGTIGMEWESDGPAIDTVLVASGGGGLVAGIAAWWADKVKVVSVEPEGSQALNAAFKAKGPVDVNVESVAADSLGASNVGALVYDICRQSVSETLLVEEDAIMRTQRHLWSEYRIAVEPGGAVALSALLSGIYRARAGERIGVLVCGANVELVTLNF